MDDKDDKFVLMNLDDHRSKKVATVLGNKTCKQILDYLTYNSEKSEEDIAKALDMKINTAEYNLKKLLETGLVEKTKKFFWSKKGKKIPLYKIAKKHIVISPKSTRPNLTVLKTLIPAVFVVAIISLVIISLSLFPGQTKTDDEFRKFSSVEELESFLEANQGTGDIYSGAVRAGAMETDSVMAEAAAPQTTEGSDQKSASTDYSETNIQVAGVDEPDIVKTNGKYIYIASGNTISIIEAYPAENMETLSEINISGAINLFINQDKLIIFSNEYGEGSKALVSIYDVSDKNNPELEKEISVDGNYVSARMIQDYVYLVANQYVGFRGGVILPSIAVDGVAEEVQATEIGYFPNPDSSYTFTNILSINLQDNDHESETYLTGSSNTIYVSEESIYLTYTKRTNPQDYYEEMVEDIFLPLLPSKQKAEVKKIMNSDDEFYEKLQSVGEIVEEYSSGLTGKDKSEFDTELLERTQDFQTKIQKKVEKTIIHKINIDKLDIEYITNGEVPGRVLNQFSMDEYDSHFRIATTTGNSWGSGSSLNHLYVLDKDLDQIGSVEDLAEGERIYSVRFMGEKAYVVTFRQVDPLFVIDLSDPNDPEVLGQLKVTGFSSYLHPYDEDHIIGIGKEATEEGRVTGVKIALFDVSDVENPIQKAKYEVEGKWSNSNALYEHKAFLFNKEKNLLVLPMSYSEESTNSEGLRKYDHWQGAFVFNIDKDEISLRGKIDHKEDNEEQGHYYGPYAVQRSLYIDDVLYTISRSLIKANNLDSLDEINKVELPYTDRIYYGRGSRGDTGIGIPDVAISSFARSRGSPTSLVDVSVAVTEPN